MHEIDQGIEEKYNSIRSFISRVANIN